MKLSQIVIIFALLITLGLTACGAETAPTATTAEAAGLLTDSEQATAEASDSPSTITPSPSTQPTATHTPLPSATPTSTFTSTPAFTPTPTPTPVPLVKLDEEALKVLNVRAGPGTDYPVVGRFEPGQETTVTGRNEDGSWWQIHLPEAESDALGWVFATLVTFSGDDEAVPIVAESLPAPTPVAKAEVETEANPEDEAADSNEDGLLTPEEELANQLRCGKDFCVTYQAMLPIWENGGCVGNHSIYITVLEGVPPGKPIDGVVIGDTFNNVEVASGSHGPGRTEITLWSNSMTLIAKRHIDGTPYTSEESFNFTSHDELIPAEVLAANGYCEGSVEKCRWAQQHNQVCRGHYSWRVTFHKFD